MLRSALLARLINHFSKRVISIALKPGRNLLWLIQKFLSPMLAPVGFTSRIRRFNHWRQQCSVVTTCQEYDRSGFQIAGM
jgi:hypothetical protein